MIDMDLRVSSSSSFRAAAWIRRPDDAHLAVVATTKQEEEEEGTNSNKIMIIEIFSYDALSTSLSSSPIAQFTIPTTTTATTSTEGSRSQSQSRSHRPCSIIAVHPNGDDFICFSTHAQPQFFQLQHHADADADADAANVIIKLVPSEQSTPLQSIGHQICSSFSVDGTMLATGGADGHLRIFQWPTLDLILDDPKAHSSSFRDLAFSLDSEFLASTCIDGSARIWDLKDSLPLLTLPRNRDEKFELCRFSMDGAKPFLFCTVQKGGRALTTVWDMSTWTKIGHKRLLRKSASVMSISFDGKYLALGSKDGDFCVVDIKQMEISHWSKSLHPGTCIASLEFCPSERVMLSTSSEWGVVVTKLNVPADWKAWQIYIMLLGLFLSSAVVFYIFYKNSDSFWQIPVKMYELARPKIEPISKDAGEDRSDL